MAARTVPTMPTWLAGQKITSSSLNQISTFGNFWTNRPGFRMIQTAAQSVPTATYTQITMDTSVYDSDSGRAAGTPWSYTIPAGMGGRWLFIVKIEWAPNASGTRLATVARNGTTDPTLEIAVSSTNASYNPAFTASGTLVVNAGDVMSAWGFQDTGGALNTANNVNGKSFFEGWYMSPGSP